MKLSLIVMTSFYPAAQHAVHYADTLARTFGGQVVLLHANRVALFDPYIFAGEGLRREELRGAAEMKSLLARQAEKLGAPATVEIATDLLPEVARDLLARYHPALFVVGRPVPTRTGPEDFSSVVLELLQAAHIPVLLVPQGAAAANPPRRVLIAADCEEFSVSGAAVGVHQLLVSLGAAVTVAHVSALEEDDSCLYALNAVRRSGILAALPEAELRGYQHKDAVSGVLEGMHDTQADLVVVVARPRSYLGELFHESVTAQVMHQSTVPVLVVPAAQNVETPGPSKNLKKQAQRHSSSAH
ncbi:universal stress protein [Hymenobacter sp. BT683]|uniref:Universal stress protein n=1 Tax=Hymenobacter jeongseonensis TaxID=2791027 RepID=A0ABS0IIL9_9BACT|nr:universal stress protein [Hymenobacter jeongseonensis]MBF9237758.1 universal stress protein [Hymenobacter jeongseonensis]